MKAKSALDAVDRKTGIRLGVAQLAHIIERPGLKLKDKVDNSVVDVVVEKLKDPDLLLSLPTPTKAPRQEASNNNVAGGQLEPVRLQMDPLVKIKLEAAIAADQAMSRQRGWRPTVRAFGALGFQYEDPMDRVLEDEDRQIDRRSRLLMKPNVIRITQDQYDTYVEGRFRWRSTQFYNMLERLLSQLWIGERNCEGCGQPIERGFRGDVVKILQGRVKLEEAKPPKYHDPCFYLRHEKRDLELKVQGLPGDDPKVVALRAEFYVEAFERVRVELTKISGEEVDREQVVDAYRANIRYDKLRKQARLDREALHA